MIGIFLIYWIGRKYYDLAMRHSRSAWGYAILGVVIYYSMQFFLGIFLGLMFPEGMTNLDNSSKTVLNLLGIPIGLGAWWGIFIYLRNKWEATEENNSNNYESEIEKIGQED
jgi:hypothetical protein